METPVGVVIEMRNRFGRLDSLRVARRTDRRLAAAAAGSRQPAAVAIIDSVIDTVIALAVWIVVGSHHLVHSSPRRPDQGQVVARRFDGPPIAGPH